MLSKQLKYSTFSTCFWSTTILSSTFTSIPQHLPISIGLPIMPCSAVSYSASSTRSSAYFTMRINFLPILKSPKWSRPSLVKVLLYRLNRIGDNQHPCLTSLPIFTILVIPWPTLLHVQFADQSSLRQSMPMFLRICINLVQFIR